IRRRRRSFGARLPGSSRPRFSVWLSESWSFWMARRRSRIFGSLLETASKSSEEIGRGSTALGSTASGGSASDGRTVMLTTWRSRTTTRRARSSSEGYSHPSGRGSPRGVPSPHGNQPVPVGQEYQCPCSAHQRSGSWQAEYNRGYGFAAFPVLRYKREVLAQPADPIRSRSGKRPPWRSSRDRNHPVRSCLISAPASPGRGWGEDRWGVEPRQSFLPRRLLASPQPGEERRPVP